MRAHLTTSAAIAQHFGSDTTESGIEHRFRPLKKHAQAVRQAVVEGKDPYSMAGVIGAGGKGTPDRNDVFQPRRSPFEVLLSRDDDLAWRSWRDTSGC